uniref:DUF1618 domain-containing protein n=1 Tax=Panagrellus redivivus TaxID=6233 RepID=A0A7E5A145_PANRE
MKYTAKGKKIVFAVWQVDVSLADLSTIVLNALDLSQPVSAVPPYHSLCTPRQYDLEADSLVWAENPACDSASYFFPTTMHMHIAITISYLNDANTWLVDSSTKYHERAVDEARLEESAKQLAQESGRGT